MKHNPSSWKCTEPWQGHADTCGSGGGLLRSPSLGGRGLTRWTSPRGDDCRVEGLWVYFSGLSCGPQTRRRCPHVWGAPGDAWHKGARKRGWGWGGIDETHGNPTWLGDALRWKQLKKSCHLVGFPSTPTAHPVSHQTSRRGVRSMVSFAPNTHWPPWWRAVIWCLDLTNSFDWNNDSFWQFRVMSEAEWLCPLPGTDTTSAPQHGACLRLPWSSCESSVNEKKEYIF